MKHNIVENKCHSCEYLFESPKYQSELKLVTSDCKKSKLKLDIFQCPQCGLVQKKIDEFFLEESKRIYDEYEVYHQADGKDQKIYLSNNDGDRSQLIYQSLENNIFSDEGDLLEIGCGNGKFLQNFQKSNSYWNLWGSELNDSNEELINGLPNTTFYSGDLEDLDKKFDFIVMIHVLEHIINPRDFINNLKSKLKEKGKIFIQVPNLEASFFDILIADHCSHFTFDSIKIMFEEEGFEIISSEEVINKEISLLVQLSKRDSKIDIKKDNLNPLTFKIGERINWLEKFKDKAKSNSEESIIFGSSISATWMASELNYNFRFYVDEDENKINKIHEGKHIKSIEALKSGDVLILPFSSKTAERLMAKLGNKFNYISS
mgnify:FL=1